MQPCACFVLAVVVGAAGKQVIARTAMNIGRALFPTVTSKWIEEAWIDVVLC